MLPPRVGESILKKADLPPGVEHSSLRTHLEVGGKPVQFRGLLGVHPPDADPDETECYTHLDLSVYPTASPTTRGEDTWDRLVQSYREHVPECTALIQAFWRFPAERSIFVVDLPISLGDEVVGFSHIQGVRLVQFNDEGTEELYSVVLDNSGEERTGNVAVEFDTPNDEDVLIRGHKRAVEIADLAIEVVGAAE